MVITGWLEFVRPVTEREEKSAIAISSNEPFSGWIYHFGGRDPLLRAVLGRARQRQLDSFGELLKARPNEPYTVTLERAWATMAGPDGQPYLRMFGQLRQSAEQQLWPDFRRQATTDWLPPLEQGLRSIGRPELATLLLAVIRGLLMDLDATGDTARTDRAFRHFLNTIQTRVALKPGRDEDGLSSAARHRSHQRVNGVGRPTRS